VTFGARCLLIRRTTRRGRFLPHLMQSSADPLLKLVELLHSRFLLKGISCPTSQKHDRKQTKIFSFQKKSDIAGEQSWLEIWTRFADFSAEHAVFSRPERAHLQRVVNDLVNSVSEGLVTWFPEYGAAILCKEMGTTGKTLFRVIGLDKWEFLVHSSVEGRDHTALCHGKKCCYEKLVTCGSVVWPNFNRYFEKRKKLHEEARSAQNKDTGGHQRTPAFIASCLAQAIETDSDDDVIQPRGALTDVGLHTGGKPRDTCFSLVIAVIQTLFEDESRKYELVWKQCYTHFLIWIMETLAPDIHTEPVVIDIFMKVLAETTSSVAFLNLERVDTTLLEERCKKARESLEHKIDAHNEILANQNSLTLTELQNPKTRDLFMVNLPTQKKISKPKPNDSIQNLGMIQLFDQNQTIDSWLKTKEKLLNSDSNKPGRTTEIFLVLRTTENYFFQLLCDETRPSDPCSDQTCQLSSWFKAFASYLDFVLEIQKINPGQETMQVQIRSVELLLTWVIYFLFFRHTKNICAKLPVEFGVCLDYKELECLVLSEPAYRDVLKLLVLKLNENTVIDRPLFAIERADVTIEFARAYAKQNYQQIFQNEQKRAQIRKDNHWNEVREKQREAEELRESIEAKKREIFSLKRTADQKDSEFNEWEKQCRYVRRNMKPQEYWEALNAKNSADGDVSTAEFQLKSLEGDLKRTLVPPEIVIQPLPSTPDQAYPVIFFLRMPQCFHLLATLGFIAQRLLRSYSFSNDPPKQEKETWQNHFREHNDCSSSINCPPAATEVWESRLTLPFPLWRVTPKASSSVDRMTNPDDDVFHPNGPNQTIHWNAVTPRGYKCAYPPYLPDTLDPSFWNEKLPKEQLQEFSGICQSSASVSRGNLGIARQDLKPVEMTKPAFLALTSIRSFPHLQIRKICSALKEDILHLEHPETRAILRQALYQIGNIEIETKPCVNRPLKITATKKEVVFSWHKDLFYGGLEQLQAVVEQRALDIYDSPSQRTKLLLIGELCGFLCTTKPGDPPLSFIDKCVEGAFGWTKAELHVDRVKRCMFLMHAIICFRYYDSFQEYQAHTLIKLNVQIQQLFVVCENEITKQEKSEFELLRFLYYQTIATRINLVRGFISQRLLSECLGYIIHKVPKSLVWENLGNDCWKSKDVELEDNYSINCLNGTILKNGMPISDLGNVILEHPLFRRNFGTNFEVTKAADGYSETSRLIDGKKYRFLLDEGQLFVQEIDAVTNQKLILMNPDPDIATWLEDLPARLLEMHSHWLDEELGIIYLRGIKYNNRKCSYILKTNPDKPAQWICQVIPKHLESLSPHELMKNEYKLEELKHHVNLEETIRIFSRIEDPKFIHLHQSDTGVLHIVLPRLLDQRFQIHESGPNPRIESLDYRDFFLSRTQHLCDTLHGFENYLLLENSKNGDQLLLTVEGTIQRTGYKKGKCKINVVVPEECNAEIRPVTFSIHPTFQTLEANSVHTRLLLAAIYTASSSLLPEKRTKMTGEAYAMELVRKSWVNRPLTDRESDALDNIVELCFCLPSLHLLCYELSCSSQQFDFLYGCSQQNPVEELFSDASLEYQQLHPYHRASLTKQEIHSIYPKSAVASSFSPAIPRLKKIKPYTTPHPGVESNVDGVVKSLSALIKEQKPGSGGQFPIHFIEDTQIAKKFISELKESYQYYTSEPKRELSKPLDEIHTLCQRQLKAVQNKEFLFREYLFEITSMKEVKQGAYYRLLRIGDHILQPTERDFVYASFDTELLKKLNPLLTKDDRKIVLDAIFVWMELITLKDKLIRLISENDRSKVLQELSTERIWNLRDHPRWIAFEIEGRLQIRQNQYQIAKTLIDHPGTICQLNMGEGKTRVILPMLIMNWIDKIDKLQRIHFLSPLLEEGFSHLHLNLTATRQNIRFLRLPYNRDKDLTDSQLSIIHASLKQATTYSNVLVVSPEDRMSMYLKSIEKRSEPISNILKKIHYLDIFDEVDDILRHKYQLIYAAGTPGGLDQGLTRWELIQAVLAIVGEVSSIRDSCSLESTQIKATQPGCFHPIRFHKGPKFEVMKEKLAEDILEHLFANPPRGYEWLNLKKTGLMKIYILRPDVEMPPALRNTTQFPENQIAAILILRGLFACGLLFHCMFERHRVYYGTVPKNKKRLAIPFRAADLPSLRSEFSHPDCALLYTHLAYYYEGLTMNQLLEAFQSLLKTGKSQQKNVYDRWYQSSNQKIQTIDCIEKIDISNSHQLKCLFQNYSHNRETINYWLSACVLPSETGQYPSRLVATAWDLAENPKNGPVGFSGTNDASTLLPLQVEEKALKDSSMFGTNGKMIELIRKNEKYTQIQHESTDPIWKSVLNHLVNSESNALIDAGGLMAGIENRAAAQEILNRLLKKDSSCKGVCYFDQELNEWCVMNTYRKVTPRVRSPIKERETIVYFDESHCRGTDMQLLPDARGILTVGPKMLKDKLIQAAGRMRQLHLNQAIEFLGSTEASMQIRAINKLPEKTQINSTALLVWLLDNTTKNTKEGLLEWAIHGMIFAGVQKLPEKATLPEDTKLKTLYLAPVRFQKIQETFLQQRKIHDRLFDEQLGDNELMDKIQAHVEKYGIDKESSSMAFSQESERELMKTVEQEQQKEKEQQEETPRHETTIDWSPLLTAKKVGASPVVKSPMDWPTLGGVKVPIQPEPVVTLALSTFWKDNPSLGRNNWDCVFGESKFDSLQWKKNLYWTRNFIETLDDHQTGPNYLRQIDCFLLFPDGSILVVSDREADQIIQLMWNMIPHPQLPLFISLSLGFNFVLPSGTKAHPGFKHPNTQFNLVSLELFNGKTAFPQPEQKKLLRAVLNNNAGCVFAREIVLSRGYQAMFPCSHLENECNFLQNQ